MGQGNSHQLPQYHRLTIQMKLLDHEPTPRRTGGRDMFVVEPVTQRPGGKKVGTPGQSSSNGPRRCDPELVVEDGSFGPDIHGLIEDWLVEMITDTLIRESESQTESEDM
jgi:hypothetical protein